MFFYIRRYLLWGLLAVAFMCGEVCMDLMQPKLMSRIVDEGVMGLGTGGSDMGIIVHLGLWMLGCVVLGCFCGSMNTVFVNLAGQHAGNEIRKDCFARILSLSFSQVDAAGTGMLITRVTNDVTQVENMLSQFIRGLVRTSCLLVGSAFFMYQLHHAFGLLIVIALPLLVLIMGIILRLTNRSFLALQAELDAINRILSEDIAGIRIIKACVREAYEKRRFGRANEALLATQLHVLVLFALMNPLVNLVMGTLVVLVLWQGGQMAAAGMIRPGLVIAAISYTTTMLMGVMMLVMLFQTISRGLASWKRLRTLLQMEPAIRDGAHDVPPGRGEVCFEHVSFGYHAGQEILHDINLVIHPGEHVAIMGATGTGKTTLLSLIPRFYEVTEGRVLVDGVDVRDYRLSSLRGRIAFGLQRSELFTATMAENIRWGQEDASLDEVRHAAAIAQAEVFIRRQPHGFDAMVAERGTSLSGGQKQRLAIARAVLRRAEIRIFDDSTSALDLRTEARLCEALDREDAGVTRITVAQRIASARHADRIVLLEHGRIAADGTHEELLQTSALYRSLYDSQLGEEAKDHEG